MTNDIEKRSDGTDVTSTDHPKPSTVSSNPYEPPHVRELDPVASSLPRLTLLATRWLGVYFVSATAVGLVVFTLRARRHQLQTPALSLAAWAAYVGPHFSRVVANAALAVLFLKGRPRFGTAAFVLQLLSFAVSADRLAAMLGHGVDPLSILPAMNAPLSVIATALLAFGPPSRAQVRTGIVIVCVCLALDGLLLSQILLGRQW